MHLNDLRVYPVKSCRGIVVDEWPLAPTGLQHDRSFMVVTPDGTYLTQRERPSLAVVSTAFVKDQLVLTVPGGGRVFIGLGSGGGEPRKVRVWDDVVAAVDQGDAAARLLTGHLGTDCRLVRFGPEAFRAADAQYAPPETPVGFADGFPLLLTSQASLGALNDRLSRPLPMNRFRPNLVVAGSGPFAEDSWRRIRIGSVEMDVVKPCARCAITTVDQETGRRDGAEPLRELGRFRRGERGVLFGQNVAHRALGTLRVGDLVQVLA